MGVSISTKLDREPKEPDDEWISDQPLKPQVFGPTVVEEVSSVELSRRAQQVDFVTHTESDSFAMGYSLAPRFPEIFSSYR